MRTEIRTVRWALLVEAALITRHWGWFNIDSRGHSQDLSSVYCVYCVLRKEGLWWVIHRYPAAHVEPPDTQTDVMTETLASVPDASVQVNQYYLERCFSRQTLIHDEEWVPITAHTIYYLHVNPAVEGFVYSPLHMAREGLTTIPGPFLRSKQIPAFCLYSSHRVYLQGEISSESERCSSERLGHRI